MSRPSFSLVGFGLLGFAVMALGLLSYAGLRDVADRRQAMARAAAVPRMSLGVQREWVATIVVNASCRFSRGDSLHAAVLSLQHLRDSLRKDTTGALLRTRLIVLDPYATAGDVGERWRSRFDEVIYGGSWSNTALVHTVSLDTSAVLAVPSLLVTESSLFRSKRKIRRSGESLVLGALGAQAITDSLQTLVKRMDATRRPSPSVW